MLGGHWASIDDVAENVSELHDGDTKNTLDKLDTLWENGLY
jgi:hypothetical protein